MGKERIRKSADGEENEFPVIVGKEDQEKSEITMGEGNSTPQKTTTYQKDRGLQAADYIALHKKEKAREELLGKKQKKKKEKERHTWEPLVWLSRTLGLSWSCPSPYAHGISRA